MVSAVAEEPLLGPLLGLQKVAFVSPPQVKGSFPGGHRVLQLSGRADGRPALAVSARRANHRCVTCWLAG